ncbi:MAG: PLD nuclease N-terminal domain-containing protein [Woeseiaceae bacterium]|nr:PLD nuclease N-terminal domain-containing protein [Woeseiaceae bacterium]
MDGLGIFGIIHLILVVYAGIQILNSKRDSLAKLIWILVVAAFPVVGLIIWYFAGAGSPKRPE